MSEIKELIKKVFQNEIQKAVISKPLSKQGDFKKITVNKMSGFYQIAKYTEKQVFHENIAFEKISDRCGELTENNFLQFNAWSESREFIILISKKRLPRIENKNPEIRKRSETRRPQQTKAVPFARGKNH